MVGDPVALPTRKVAGSGSKKKLIERNIRMKKVTLSDDRVSKICIIYPCLWRVKCWLDI